MFKAEQQYERPYKVNSSSISIYFSNTNSGDQVQPPTTKCWDRFSKVSYMYRMQRKACERERIH